MPSYNWTLLVKVPKGHRFFRDENTRQIAIADASGATPDRTDDGVLWIDTRRMFRVGAGKYGTFVDTPLVRDGAADKEGSTAATSDPICEQTERVLDLFPKMKIVAADESDLADVLLANGLRARREDRLQTHKLELVKKLAAACDYASSDIQRMLEEYEATGDHDHGRGPLEPGQPCDTADCVVANARAVLAARVEKTYERMAKVLKAQRDAGAQVLTDRDYAALGFIAIEEARVGTPHDVNTVREIVEATKRLINQQEKP